MRNTMICIDFNHGWDIESLSNPTNCTIWAENPKIKFTAHSVIIKGPDINLTYPRKAIRRFEAVRLIDDSPFLSAA